MSSMMVCADTLLEQTRELTLLYMEDDPITRSTTLRMLEEFFERVIVSDDTSDALEKFATESVDLIITDIAMHHTDGIALLSVIKQSDPQLPVIVISAYSDTDYFMRAIEAGVDAYLLKPFDLQQFCKTLSRIVTRLLTLRQAKESITLLQQYQMIVDETTIVSKTNTNGIITYVNDAFCQISGYKEEELIGQPHSIVRHPQTESETFRQMWRTIKEEKCTWHGILKNRKKDGSAYHVKTSVAPILKPDGEIEEFIAIRSDVSDLMHQQRTFENDIATLVDPVIVYMKLEDFSVIEDFYDTRTTTLIQKHVKDFLSKEAQKANILLGKIYQLRYGEFAITFDKSQLPFEIETYIRRIKAFRSVIKDQFVIVEDLQFQVSLLISVAYDHAQVLESARIGIKKLHEIKKDFIIANNFAHLEKVNAQKNLQIISTIKEAIRNDKIVSFFQPIFDNTTEKIVRYESLVRLIDRENRILTPYAFLDIAKKGKYYHQITRIVLENSFQTLERHDIDIAINISLEDLHSYHIRQEILALLKRYRRHADRITFELLEDNNTPNNKQIRTFINQIKAYGVKIAIDDFGSGYANYERLLSYQPDILKIDGSLIKNIDQNRYSYSLVKTIVTFAKDQQIRTTAEFVENETIFNIVRELGIDYSQGYYFAKPEPL